MTFQCTFIIKKNLAFAVATYGYLKASAVVKERMGPFLLANVGTFFKKKRFLLAYSK